MCILYIYIIINIDQYCTCTYDQCLNPLPATQLRSNNAWPRAPLQRPLRMQPARGRRATGDRDSVDLGELGALDLGACWEVETPNSSNYELWWIMNIYLSESSDSEFKIPASLMGRLVKCYESFGWIDVRRATPVQVQSWRFFARISMQGILTSPSECVFCLFINIPKMKQIVEFWWERYTSITLPLICLNVLVLTGYLFGYCWLYAWLFGIASPWHPTNQNPVLPFWYI